MKDHLDEIWSYVSGELKATLPSLAYGLWFSDLKLIGIKNDKAYFIYPSAMKRDILIAKHLDKLNALLAETLGFDVHTVIIATDQLSPDNADDQAHAVMEMCNDLKITPDAINTSTGDFLINYMENNDIFRGDDNIVEPDYYDSLNNGENIYDSKNPPKQYHREYTFSNFVVGNTNKYAHAACIAVANSPATSTYNPLFIYGPSGLGKTHLLYAITNQILNTRKDYSIIYVKGEEFTNQLIEAIAKKSTPAFREKYRRCDVLLIDDIQFIAGKNMAQEELFYTFDELHDHGKQIILASDRPPRDIATLEERLRSRFESGLMADVQPPDIELRKAILMRKAEDLNIQVSGDVLDFLADKIKSNIRQLEGVLKRLDAFSRLSNNAISMELARSTIADIIPSEDNTITKERIIGKVCERYGVSEDDLRGKKRTRDIAKARFIAIYILRTLTDLSSPEIGREFQRDHSTVLNAESSISDEIKRNPQIEFEVNDIIRELRG